MHKICKEFAKMEKHCNLWLVEWQQKEEALSAFIQEDLTDEQWQAAHDIMEKRNGPEGPTPEVQECKEVWSEVHAEFHGGDVAVLQMRIVSWAGWKNEEGIIQACCMDFNNDIGGGHMLTTSTPSVPLGGSTWEMHMRILILLLGKRCRIWQLIDQGPNGGSSEVRRACGKWLAKVPFKKLGQYQTNMILSHHLPPNFTFTVDPSHMHSSTAMELLNFWKECQILRRRLPTTCTFLKSLPGENLVIPDTIARRLQCLSGPAHQDTNDEDQHEVMSTKDERAGNEALPVVKHPSTSRQSMIQLKGSQVTAELQDASGYMDDDEFDSMPFADVCTTQSGLSRQHDQGKIEISNEEPCWAQAECHGSTTQAQKSSNPQQSTVKPTKAEEQMITPVPQDLPPKQVQWLKKVSQCWVILERSCIGEGTTKNEVMGLQGV
ncbi:hypothetical protein F5141DRAFT_1068577 [Pisolithus sp. B1]|nr:hypothetical protein F5141DRAFT_1068577 [Pisolithus sp. B1]